MQSTPRKCPPKLLEMSKLTHKEKMEIFESRNNIILKFLADESFSSLENISYLISTPKQTAMRLGDKLEANGYIVSSLVAGLCKTRAIRVFEAKTLGLLNAMGTNDDLPIFKSLKSWKIPNVMKRLQCQKIRIFLEKQGYHNFVGEWKLNIAKNNKTTYSNRPDYLCENLNNKKIAIFYYDEIDFNQLTSIIKNLNEQITLGELDLIHFYFANEHSEKIKNVLIKAGVSLDNFLFLETANIYI